MVRYMGTYLKFYKSIPQKVDVWLVKFTHTFSIHTLEIARRSWYTPHRRMEQHSLEWDVHNYARRMGWRLRKNCTKRISLEFPRVFSLEKWNHRLQLPTVRQNKKHKYLQLRLISSVRALWWIARPSTGREGCSCSWPTTYMQVFMRWAKKKKKRGNGTKRHETKRVESNETNLTVDEQNIITYVLEYATHWRWDKSHQMQHRKQQNRKAWGYYTILCLRVRIESPVRVAWLECRS